MALTVATVPASNEVIASQKNPEAAGLVVAVTSELKADRPSETITLDWKMLASRLPSLKPDYVTVKDHQTGKQIASQCVDVDGDGDTDELVFQSDFIAREPTRAFIIEASAERATSMESKVFARYVPERDDDFAWENDRIAFRMYGKALEPRLTSSGIDVWTKRTRNLIINKWFKMGDDAYHKDHGEGLDMYSVKLSRGCGGSGIWDGKRLHVSRNYKTWKVIANGPVRAIFELTYEPWDVNGVKVSEVKRITLDAGQNLNRIESTLKFDGKNNSLDFAIGVARHKDWKQESDFSKEQGWFSRWENTGENGFLGCAVLIDPKKITGQTDEEVAGLADEDGNHLVITTAQSGKSVLYYAGAGWDRSGDFRDKAAWHSYLDRFARRLRLPLKISFLRKGNDSMKPMAKRVAGSVLAGYPDPRDLNLRGWDYHNGFFLSSLFELWERDKDAKYLKYIRDWVDLYVDEAGRIDEKAYKKAERQLDDILPGRLLVSLYRLTGEEKYRKAAFYLTDQLREQPRTGDGGYWHKNVYPHQMWLDGIYMASLFSIEFAEAFKEPRSFDEACHQIALVYRHTFDSKTGLLYHGWDESRTQVWANAETGASPEFWGRAIGWYAMALVDSLDKLPKDHAKRGELINILKSLASSLARHQDAKTGLWYQIIDKGERSDNWHETSASSMFVYALAKGARMGYIDARYLDAAKKAYQGILNNHVYTDQAGRFYLTGTAWIGTLNPKVSKGDYDSYVKTARQLNDIKGVAAFLWASLEMERMAHQ